MRAGRAAERCRPNLRGPKRWLELYQPAGRALRTHQLAVRTKDDWSLAAIGRRRRPVMNAAENKKKHCVAAYFDRKCSARHDQQVQRPADENGE